jgi:uncharacterized membrane protein
MYGFEAIVFDGKRTARKALDTLEDYAPGYVWIDDVALVSRNHIGHVSIHSTWAQDSSAASDGGWGATAGAIVGMLFGPGGALAGGVIGGSMGGLIGAATDVTFDDPALDDFAATLAKNSSALVLVGEKPTLGDFDGVISPLDGKIVRTDLNEKDVKKIRKALKQDS